MNKEQCEGPLSIHQLEEQAKEGKKSAGLCAVLRYFYFYVANILDTRKPCYLHQMYQLKLYAFQLLNIALFVRLKLTIHSCINRMY